MIETSLEFIPYQPSHFSEVTAQAEQKWQQERAILLGQPDMVAIPDMSWTGLVGNRVVGCAGFLPKWEGRVLAWALFGPEIPRTAWPKLVKKVQKEIKVLFSRGIHRVEVPVPAAFHKGCRLVELLGFQSEGVLRAYGPAGEDFISYSLVSP